MSKDLNRWQELHSRARENIRSAVSDDRIVPEILERFGMEYNPMMDVIPFAESLRRIFTVAISVSSNYTRVQVSAVKYTAYQSEDVRDIREIIPAIAACIAGCEVHKRLSATAWSAGTSTATVTLGTIGQWGTVRSYI